MKRRYSQVGTASGPTTRSTVRYGIPGAVARPFKRVRVQGGSLVPYGRTSYIVPSALRQGARNVKKGMDTAIAGQTSDSNMSSNTGIYVLNMLVAGTGSWNRIGRIIDMKSIRLRLKLSCAWDLSPYESGNPDVATPPNFLDSRSCRLVLVYDRQPNGTLPLKSDIFQYKTAMGQETGDWNAMLAFDNMERFTILRDETFTFEAPPINQIYQFDTNGQQIQTGYPKVNIERTVDIYQRLNHRTNYKAESSNPSYADISSGALYLINMCEPDVSSDSPDIVVTGVARLRYLDQ